VASPLSSHTCTNGNNGASTTRERMKGRCQAIDGFKTCVHLRVEGIQVGPTDIVKLANIARHL